MRFPPRSACLALAVLTAVIFAGSTTPRASPPPVPPTPPAPLTDPAALDEPLRRVAEARRAWLRVDDYTCVLVRRERVRGRLLPEEVMLMKVRREPHSVYLRWAGPRALTGQEACYVAGRHGGKMRARGPGLLGAVGFVTLDVNDPRAREYSKHTITEAGVGPLIERLGREWEAARRRAPKVRVADAEYDGRPCRRIEVASEGASRMVAYFDTGTRLPVCVEWYNGDELSEADGYTKMRLNVGLQDGDFDY
jgi:hypothetical protein